MRFQRNNALIQKKENGPLVETVFFSLASDQPEENKSVAGNRTEYPEREQPITYIRMFCMGYLHEEEA